MMNSVFSEYLLSLTPTGEPPNAAAFKRLCHALKHELIYTLKRRDLWNSPPRALGIYSGDSWSEGDALEELLLVCYRYIFIDRLWALKHELTLNRNINSIISQNLNNHLFNLHRRHNPIEFKISTAVQAAAGRLMRAGKIFHLSGSRGISHNTILGFNNQANPNTIYDTKINTLATTWNRKLFPELIIERSRHTDVSLERLILELPKFEIEAFKIHHLINSIKNDTQARWRTITQSASTKAKTTSEDIRNEWNFHIQNLQSDNSTRDRQIFDHLFPCIELKLNKLSENKNTRKYLHRLWLFLRQWTLTTREIHQAKESSVHDFGELSIGLSELEKLLKIPADEIPHLKVKLGEIITECSLLTAAVSTTSNPTRIVHHSKAPQTLPSTYPLYNKLERHGRATKGFHVGAFAAPYANRVSRKNNEATRFESVAIARIPKNDSENIVTGRPYILETGFQKREAAKNESLWSPSGVIFFDVIVRCDNASIEPSHLQSIQYSPSKDLELIIFTITFSTPGVQKIHVEFYYRASWLTSIHLDISVLPETN